MMLVSQRITQVMNRLGPVAQFFTASTHARRVGEPGICDFAVGNPHELALPGFVAALGQYVAPQNDAWFGYKGNEPEGRAAVAAAVRERRGLPFEVEEQLGECRRYPQVWAPDDTANDRRPPRCRLGEAPRPYGSLAYCGIDGAQAPSERNYDVKRGLQGVDVTLVRGNRRGLSNGR